MDVTVEKVADEAGALAWHTIAALAVPLDHPGLRADPVEEIVALLPDGPPSQKKCFYLGRASGEAVVVGSIELPMVDNLHFSSAAIIVTPRLRRRGYGRQMFEFLREQARLAGRSVLVVRTGAPLGGTSAGESFARALGARPALEEIRRELKLATINREALKLLERQALEHSEGYELVQWIDHAPEGLLVDAARLASVFVTEAPMGELSLEAERWDPARIREWEQETVAQGRMRVSTGALHIDTGRLVAATDIAVARSRPAIAYQWGTLVDPDHRGHRLGLLAKIANLIRLERELAGVEVVETWNALDNTHMVAINEAMGFCAVERFVEWQLEI